MIKKKILFIMHMPPPVHGAAMMGQYIHDSKLINEAFECVYINSSASKNVADVGKISLKKIGFLFSNLYAIIKTIRREKPDLCYLTPTSDGYGIYRDMLTIKILKLMKKKIVLHMHNKGIKNFSKRHFTHFAYHTIFSNVKVILLAKELYEDVKEFVKYENVFICPNGIPKTSEIPFQRKKVNNIYTFLFLSNMIEEKGVKILLEACVILKKNGYQFKCDFVGRWSDITEEKFEREISLLGLTHKEVKAYGAKYNNEKNAFLIDSDALVFPSYYHGETFGLVLIEAMEYALPCISTYEGGIPSVINNNQTGLLVPSKNSKKLAEKMIWLIENAEKGLEMGKNGQKRFFEKFTLESFEKEMVSILNKSIT